MMIFELKLDKTVDRLNGCHALLCALTAQAEHSITPVETLDAVDDLLMGYRNGDH